VLERFNLEKTYQYLLVVLAFLMPISVSLANTVIVCIVLLWFFSGDYKAKFSQIISNKVLIASLVFYSTHIIGMLWTDNLEWGFHILHKMWYFLILLPILLTIVKKDYVKHYIISFLAAMAITEILSYLVWFEIIDEFRKAYYNNPTPFMSHISFNPFLAFTIYLVSHEILFNRKLNNKHLFLLVFFLVAMVINMFVTGGRAGQVMFFFVIVILCFQFFREHKIKALISIFILVPGLFFAAFQSSPIFKERSILAIDEVSKFNVSSVSINQSVTSSVGVRLLFAMNSWEIIKENPFFGVGTGDFPTEYKKMNQKNSPNGPYANNPHNMYTLILVQLGIFGLLSMFSVFYFQIKISLMQSNIFFKDLGLALPLLFLVIMWSDSYLLGHFTGLLFIFFSAFLYKDFEQ
jgi:O-antigen ligase